MYLVCQYVMTVDLNCHNYRFMGAYRQIFADDIAYIFAH